MIIEIKRFEDMSRAEQRQHILDSLTDDGKIDLSPAEFEDLRKIFLKRQRTAKNGSRAYLTCREIAEAVGKSKDTIYRMAEKDKRVKKTVHSGRNRKPYTTYDVPRTVAREWFPDAGF